MPDPPWPSGSGGPSQVQQPNLPLAGPGCGTTLAVPVQVPIHLQGPVVAPYPRNFCFQEPAPSASGGMYSTLSALTRRTHRDALAYCILSDLLHCGYQKPALGPEESLLAMLAGRLVHSCHGHSLSSVSAGQARGPLGSVRLGWSTSSGDTPQICSGQSVPHRAVLRNLSLYGVCPQQTQELPWWVEASPQLSTTDFPLL